MPLLLRRSWAVRSFACRVHQAKFIVGKFFPKPFQIILRPNCSRGKSFARGIFASQNPVVFAAENGFPNSINFYV